MRRLELVKQVDCSLHEGERADLVNALIHKQWTTRAIASQVRRHGHAIDDATIAKHRRFCFVNSSGKKGAMKPLSRRLEGPDLAVLVRNKVAQELDTLDISVRDGLVAQQLLDRREETRRDREFMVNLARLLTGGGKQAPKQLIEEGDYVDVTPDPRLLAPPELRDPT